jgi:hypothetical protein
VQHGFDYENRAVEGRTMTNLHLSIVNRLVLRVPAAFLLIVIALPARAITLTPGDTVSFDYDFSASLTSSWTGWQWQILGIPASNPWEAGTSVYFSVVSSSPSTPLGADTYSLASPTNAIGEVEDSFLSSLGPFPSTLSIATFSITSIDADFAFDQVNLRLVIGDAPVTDYQVLYSESVPESSALALMAIGLAGLGFARRKKA